MGRYADNGEGLWALNSDPWENLPYGWPALEADSLGMVIGEQEGLHPDIPLPERLVEAGFKERPWPDHPLDERVIDLDYAAWVRPLPPDQMHEIEIVGERRLAFNDKKYNLVGITLVAVNVGLLAGMYLRREEMRALYPWSANRTFFAIQQKRLNERLGIELFESRVYGTTQISRISPHARFRDLRGDAPLIG